MVKLKNEKKINKRMKIYKKGKLRPFKLNLLKRFRDEKNAQSSLRNQTHYKQNSKSVK